MSGILPSLFGINGAALTAAEIAPSFPISLTLLGGGRKKNKKKRSRKTRKTRKNKSNYFTEKSKRSRKTKNKKRRKTRKTLYEMRESLNKSIIKDKFEL
tara:strand:- start:292 stop:588 length:297 start_codon:yes stop_codon:yes gene_type:complete